jgi:hypothetical protein
MYWQNAGIYCGASFVQILFMLCTGLLCLRMFKIQIETPFKWLFYAICTGIYVWILITALIFTQGKTVLAGTLPLVLLLLWTYHSNTDKKKIKINTFSYRKILKYLPIIAVIGLWTFWLNMHCISTDGNNLYLPHFDILHSIEISKNMQLTGTESYYWWQKSNKTFPYHYAEIWLHAGIQALWHTQKTWTWQGIVLPLLQTTLIIGLLAILEQHQKKINFFMVLVACSFILFQGWLNFSLPHFDTHFDFTRYISMIGAPKFIVIGIFCILYMLSRDFLKLFILMFLPVFSVLTLPVVTIWIFLLWAKVRSKTTLLGLLFLLVWLIGFYTITGQYASFGNSLTVLLPKLNVYFWKTNFYFVLISIIFYLPVFFWIKEKTVLKHFAIIFTVSYSLFLIFYKWYDSYQFLVLLWIPLMWVYSWVIMINSQKKYIKILFGCMIGLSLIQTFFYKRDFQRTTIDNTWIHELYLYLDKYNLLQKGASLSYYDIRQLHAFAWQKKEIKLLPLLAQPIFYDGITQKYPSDSLTAVIIQKTLPFQPKNSQKDIEKQVFLFCKQHDIRFLIYPNTYKFDEMYKEHILQHFENSKDNLSCIVFRTNY